MNRSVTRSFWKLQIAKLFRWCWQIGFLLACRFQLHRPYFCQSVRLVGWLFRLDGLQRLLFRRLDRFLNKLRTELELPIQEQSEYTRHTIVCYCMSSLLFSARLTKNFTELPAVYGPDIQHSRAGLLQVEGAAFFQEAYARGKGVILVGHHCSFMSLIYTYLNAIGIENPTVIGKGAIRHREQWEIDAGRKDTDKKTIRNRKNLMYLRQMFLAQTRLKTGGVAIILGDGLRMKAGISRPYFNRLRPFAKGFAELAVSTDALVIPMAVRLELDGKLILSFFPPLTCEAEPTHSGNCIDCLVGQFAAHYEDISSRATANLWPNYLKKTLTYPRRELQS